MCIYFSPTECLFPLFYIHMWCVWLSVLVLPYILYVKQLCVCMYVCNVYVCAWWCLCVRTCMHVRWCKCKPIPPALNAFYSMITHKHTLASNSPLNVQTTDKTFPTSHTLKSCGLKCPLVSPKCFSTCVPLFTATLIKLRRQNIYMFNNYPPYLISRLNIPLL